MDITTGLAIAIPTIVVAYAILSSLRQVRPTQKGLIERLGKYHKFAPGGLTFLVPFVDKIIKVNTTERMSPVEKQDVITKDKVFMGVDAVVFYKVKPDEASVKASEYNVSNFSAQIDTLARTVLRDIIGSMDMTEANISRPIINEKLKAALDTQTEAWGIQVVRAEIKDLIPPEDLIKSMESVLTADNARQAAEKTAVATATLATGQRNAAIAEAEGIKQATILRAEASQQSQILTATGQRQASILVAEGQARATELTNTALNTYFKDNAVRFKELEVTQASLQNNTKIIVPEGKAISLILDERNGLEKKSSLIPIQQPEADRGS